MTTLFDDGFSTSGLLNPSPLMGASPKFNTNNRVLDNMARLFIPLASEDVRKQYLTTIQSPDARKLAEVLAVQGSKFGGQNNGTGYIDFLLGQVQESYTEKVQIADVLSDNYIAYFFGSSPPVFNYSGVVYNTKQDNWRSALSLLYRYCIRGTQLARRGQVVCLAYDDVVVTGALLNMSQQLTAEMQTSAQFSFSILVKRYDIYRDEATPITQREPLTGSLSGSIGSTTLSLLGNAQIIESTVPATIRTVGLPTRSTVDAAQDTDADAVDQTSHEPTSEEIANEAKQAQNEMSYPPISP